MESRGDAKFPELAVCIGIIRNVQNKKENPPIVRLRKTVCEEVRAKYNIETLKDDRTVHAYRDFYWKLDVDPTKTRPSGEALLRRVLHGDALPDFRCGRCIQFGFDENDYPYKRFRLGSASFAFSSAVCKGREAFMGIGMNKPVTLTDKMLVLADQTQVLCIYPYRDCDHTKITMQTQNLMVIGYRVIGVTEQQLEEAVETTLAYVKQVSQGEIGRIKVLGSSRQ